MDKSDSYKKQFHDLFYGPAWFGESYMEKLKDVDDELAFLKPTPDIHSIAELISHCIFWRKALINILQESGKKLSMSDPENWILNEELKTVGFPDLLNNLENSQKKILKLLETLSPEKFALEYREGAKIEDLLTGVIHHDIYHLGQIALVKKLLSK